MAQARGTFNGKIGGLINLSFTGLGVGAIIFLFITLLALNLFITGLLVWVIALNVMLFVAGTATAWNAAFIVLAALPLVSMASGANKS